MVITFPYNTAQSISLTEMDCVLCDVRNKVPYIICTQIPGNIMLIFLSVFNNLLVVLYSVECQEYLLRG